LHASNCVQNVIRHAHRVGYGFDGRIHDPQGCSNVNYRGTRVVQGPAEHRGNKDHEKDGKRDTEKQCRELGLVIYEQLIGKPQNPFHGYFPRLADRSSEKGNSKYRGRVTRYSDAGHSAKRPTIAVLRENPVHLSSGEVSFRVGTRHHRPPAARRRYPEARLWEVGSSILSLPPIAGG